MHEGCNSCASLAGLVLSFIACMFYFTCDRSFIHVSCHVLVGLPILILPSSGVHAKARLADLVIASEVIPSASEVIRHAGAIQIRLLLLLLLLESAQQIVFFSLQQRRRKRGATPPQC